MSRPAIRLPLYEERGPSPSTPAQTAPGRKVQLICMPYQNVMLSSLSVALLASVLRERGIETTESYLHFGLARIIGRDRYHKIAEAGARDGLAGELFFGEALHGLTDDERVDRRLSPLFGPRSERAAKREEFQRYCLAQVEACNADLIGFSTSVNQLLPSLWLAGLIKERWPHVRVVLGGSACAEPMGSRISKSYDMVDHVVSGYGEEPLVDLAMGGPSTEQRVIVSEKPVNLDALPIPDYDHFMAAARGFTENPLQIMLAYESSRGCWYGEKVHCTFCGLNRLEMAYNAKSSERVVREIRTLWDRHRTHLFATDSILSRTHLKEVIPSLAEYESRPILFYEVKANMTSKEVEALRRANVAWIQPGIESLSTPLLGLLKKGVKAIQNLALLKWCRELGVAVSWNILCGIPGEDIECYRDQIRLGERYPHLEPPKGIGEILLDRYSPYFNQYRSHGWSDITPLEDYRLLHPHLGEDALRSISYHFEGVGGTCRVGEYIGDLRRAVKRWNAAHKRGDGLFWDGQTGLVRIEDGDASVIRGSSALADVIAASHDITTMPNLLEVAQGDGALIEELLDMGILYREGNHVVNLTVRLGLRSESQHEFDRFYRGLAELASPSAQLDAAATPPG